jgi:hypothetical protein
LSPDSTKRKSLEGVISDYLGTKFNLSVKEARQLAKDFSLLLHITGKQFLKFPRLASVKGISNSVMFYSMIVCFKCSISEEEGRPISTGLVLSEYDSVHQLLPDDIEIPLPKHLHIRDWKRIRKLCGYVDGENAAFIVDKSNGSIRGAKNLPTLPSRSQHFFSDMTQKLNNSIAFLVIRGCKSFRLYSDGRVAHQIILLRKYGEWTSRDCGSFCDLLKTMASSKNIDETVIQPIAQASLTISERGKGTQLLILPDPNELRHKINKKVSLPNPCKVKDMSEETLIRNVTEDGTSILNKSGELEIVEAKFDATGGRVASMIDMTNLAKDGFAVVVSVDGVISVIEDGKLVIEI